MWVVIDVGPDEMHLIPHDDLIEHTPSEDCVCGPKENFLFDGSRIISHPSLDGREKDMDWLDFS